MKKSWILALMVWVILIAALTMSAVFSFAVDLPQTGQTYCYQTTGTSTIACSGTGQDGESLKGAAWPNPRFKNNGNGTATDNLTGLMWPYENSTPTVGACTGGTMTWQGALDYVACLNSSNYLGYADWRLPNVNELESLVHADEDNGTVTWLNELGFSNSSDIYYWSSTTYFNMGHAWMMKMSHGELQINIKTSNAVDVWPVRGQTFAPAKTWRTGQTVCSDASGNVVDCTGTGQDGDKLQGEAWPNPRFTNNNNGTITDNLTGLIWLQDANCIQSQYPAFDNNLDDGTVGDGKVTWQHAIDFVAGINAGSYSNCAAGYNDWRLPNREELRSLLHYGTYPYFWLNNQVFSNVQSDLYWSSTTNVMVNGQAWIIDMYFSNVFGINKTGSPWYVWPVRGGSGLHGSSDISANPAIKNFGSVNAGSSSAAQTFTITNNGTNNLYITTVSITGADAAQFVKSNDSCSPEDGHNFRTIAPSGTCTIDVTFSPTSADAKSANLTIASNDPDTPSLDISLGGTGVQYTLTVDIGGNAYGRVTSNTGNISCEWQCNMSINNGIIIYTCSLQDQRCSESANQGTQIVLTASSDVSVQWSNCTTSSGNTCNVTLNSDINIGAIFALSTHTVTPSAGANGTINPNTPQTVTYGEPSIFTVTPEANYTASVGGSCGGTLEGNTFTTNPITTDCTVAATFALNQHTIAITQTAGGIIACNPTTVNHGSNSNCTITPNGDYSINSVTVDGVSQGAVTTYQFNNVTANHTITATYIYNPPPAPEPEPQPQPQPEPQPVFNPNPPAAGNPPTGNILPNDSPAIIYETNWTPAPDGSGGVIMQASNMGGVDASVEATFTGTAVHWQAAVSPHGGMARVYIDGVYAGMVNLNSATTQNDMTVFSATGLSSGSHTIRIAPLPSLPGFSVNINRFIVQ